MKKSIITIIILLCVNFILYEIVLAQCMMEEPKEKTVLIRASGRDLWDYLKKMDYAKKWKMWPGKKTFYKGKKPHGALLTLTTYVNDSAYMAIISKNGVLSEGAILAKENYSPDKKLMAITVMYKLKGYNPQGGDWFWAKYLSNGKIEAEGKIDMCINCHVMEKNNDYIMTSSLK